MDSEYSLLLHLEQLVALRLLFCPLRHLAVDGFNVLLDVLHEVCQGVCYPRQPLDRLLRVSNVPQHCFSLAGAEAGGLSSVCSLLKKFVPREQLSSIEHECASGQ